jgi:hypothetical protein
MQPNHNTLILAQAIKGQLQNYKHGVFLAEIRERIAKDIWKFSETMARLSGIKMSAEEERVIELAKMYASDAGAWLQKGDYYTAFSSISYAHGLADAILKIKGME